MNECYFSRGENIVGWKLVVGKHSATLMLLQKRTQQTQHQ
jgi:hypothetical protein